MRSLVLVLVQVLVACVAPVVAQGEAGSQTTRARYEALLNEWDARSREVDAAMAAARTDQERRDARNKGPELDVDDFIRRFLAVAEAAPESDGARDAALWIVETGQWADDNHNGRARQVGRAMDILVRLHLRDERVGRACLVLANFPSPNRDKFLREVVERATGDVRGRACLALARYLIAKAGLSREVRQLTDERTLQIAEERYGRDYLQHLRERDPQALLAEADRLLEQVIKDHGDVLYIVGTLGPRTKRTLAEGKSLAEVARQCLVEVRDLAIGSVAPEIVGEDGDGKQFRLSDYRGKVVVLTFSGNWCGPCRAMYPQERRLVERLKGRPFALLSVNTDKDRETLRRSIEDGEVTWRCWWDGSDGPICGAWNIASFPTTYVLDAGGVIRHKDPGNLDEAADHLLMELEAVAKTPRSTPGR